MWLEQISSNLINSVISLESIILNLTNQFWLKFYDWGFIFISTIIGAIVAIRVDRIFRARKRLHYGRLLNETFKMSFIVSATIFLWGLLIIFFAMIFIEIVKFMRNYISSTYTLLVIIVLIFVVTYLEKKRKRKIYNRLMSGKKAKKVINSHKLN